ncbi:MAG: ABC transporter ATP-binding protein [archaeon]
MDKIAVKIEKLKKHFGSNKVIDEIDLEIMSGEIFGIIGSSGSGKTTFLNMIIGYLKPDSGSVLFLSADGSLKNVADNAQDVKKRFGFAVQQPSFYENLTVFENLDYFGSLYGLSPDARLNNINALLEMVDLQHARDIISKNLSGGMQRRLDIACSLMHHPDMLILDEPTSDLDLILSRQIWQLLRKINKKGTSIIVASHDLPEVETVCSKIGILSDGKLSHVGSFDELKSKVTKGQELQIETYPGNYDAIIKQLKDAQIMSMESTGSSLIIQTKRPDKVLGKLLQLLPKIDEALLDVKITKLSLRDIFTKIKNEEYNKKKH